MYEILQRQYEPSDRMSRDGQPVGPAFIEGEPKLVRVVDSLAEVAQTFARLETAAAIADSDIEEDYIARDLSSGSWLTPYDVRALIDEVAPDTTHEDDLELYEPDDLPF